MRREDTFRVDFVWHASYGPPEDRERMERSIIARRLLRLVCGAMAHEIPDPEAAQ